MSDMLKEMFIGKDTFCESCEVLIRQQDKDKAKQFRSGWFCEDCAKLKKEGKLK